MTQEKVARFLQLELISPDPEQPRKQFPEEPLKELAERIWEQGLLQPISATATEGGRYLIFMGERRYRAFHINREKAEKLIASAGGELPDEHPALRYERWTSIPVFEEAPMTASRRLLGQVSENHDRTGLTLYERAAAIYKALLLSGMKAKEFAPLAGLTPQMMSTFKALANSSGLTKLALESGTLQDHNAASLFQQLPYDTQELYLNRAREEGATLTRVQLSKILAEIKAADERAKQADTATAGPEAPTPSAERPDRGQTEASSKPSAAPPQPLQPEGTVLSVEALIWLQIHLDEMAPAGDDEPLRLEALDATKKAVLTSAPFILIREVLGESSSSSTPEAREEVAVG
jgi:ParB family chromosome partitioning protein